MVKYLRIPLYEYPLKEFIIEHKKPKLPGVFVLEATPKFPVKAMGISLFRLDFLELQERLGISSFDVLGISVMAGKGIWFVGLVKLDLARNAMLNCVIVDDGNVRIISNDEEYAKDFFDFMVADKLLIDWTISTKWSQELVDVSTFMGGLLGIADKIDPLSKASREVQESLKETVGSYEAQNWKATIVMARRTIEAVLKDAYKKSFKKDPVDKNKKNLNLDNLIREFDKLQVIPKHWLRICDSIRLIGNLPGAHPVAIPNYKFSSEDALLALTNTTAFLRAYYSKMV